MPHPTAVSFITSFSFASVPLINMEQPTKYLWAALFSILGHLVVTVSKKAIDKLAEKKQKNSTTNTTKND